MLIQQEAIRNLPERTRRWDHSEEKDRNQVSGSQVYSQTLVGRFKALEKIPQFDPNILLSQICSETKVILKVIFPLALAEIV